MARSLGTLILAQCHTHRPFMRLESFDRFFPSQDNLPRGGFGNLIALPLQKAAREDGNTCFVDESFRPVSDPWDFLSKVRCLGSDEVKALVERESPRLKTVIKEQGVFDDIAWTRDNEIIAFDRRSVETQEFEIEDIEVTLDSMIHIPTTGLPATLISRLKRCATFANPEFYKLQRMRMQTYPHPRFIFSGELHPERLILPRGVLDDVLKLLRLTEANITLRDERVRKRKIKLSFAGELTDIQKKAVKASKKEDLGVLVAPPGAGKTVMACAIIAERRVSTLVLVHRQPLLEQWRESVHRFLEVPIKEIGRLSGSKKKISGKIDLAMLQSLSRLEDLAEIGKMYSQIIIDECHHIPASSFEAILKLLPARYVLGLTATPNRKDGLEKILYQQCGPVRYELKSVDGGLLEKVVHVHQTGWTLPVELGPKPPYHLVMAHLVNDTGRNQLVVEAAVERLNGGEFPLLVADRKAHLDKLSDLLVGQNSMQASVEIVRLDGEMSPKQRQLGIANARKLRSEGKLVLLVATGSLVGEGFDLPELDALILAVPLSFEGRLIQYVGRIHRVLDGKAKVQVVDFFDAHSPMFIKMYRNRMRAYRKMGYEIRELFGAELMGRSGFFNF